MTLLVDRLARLDRYLDALEALEATSPCCGLLGGVILAVPHAFDPLGYVATVEGADTETLAYAAPGRALGARRGP